MNAYKDVMQNNANFYDTYANKSINLNQFISQRSDSSFSTGISKFAIIDLDQDGTVEVVLWLTYGGNDSSGFEILHDQDGAIDGYSLQYREFNQLKSDGTFSFSSDAADGGFGTISFTATSYSIHKITYSQSSGNDSSGNLMLAYFVKNKSATQDEFNIAISNWEAQPNVTWYNYTSDNIKSLLTESK